MIEDRRWRSSILDSRSSVFANSVMPSEFRIGHGFDVHRFSRGRKLVLGGVEIPHSMGLIGHSDADVLLHALMNALLGAIGEGDIGVHFPDSDSTYKNIASTKLLDNVLKRMRQKRFELVNADITLVAQRPKLAPYYAVMRKSVAAQMKVGESKINIKATTTEKLGWIGQNKGMAATAVVLLSR
jgi:2-C-methyl-D-erythritol 2,4-cyclodiphosphate synthase